MSTPSADMICGRPTSCRSSQALTVYVSFSWGFDSPMTLTFLDLLSENWHSTGERFGLFHVFCRRAKTRTDERTGKTHNVAHKTSNLL